MSNELKVIVTGGAGFIGSHICEQLLSQGISVIAIDVFNDETSSPEEKRRYINEVERHADKLNIFFTCYQVDMLNEQKLIEILEKEKPNSCIHAASLVMDRASVLEADKFIINNIVGTQCLLNSIRITGTVKRLVLISTRSAVGETTEFDGIMREDDLPRPINPYGATKVAMEALCCAFQKNFSCTVSICRLNPVYGSRCRRDMLVRLLFENIIYDKPFIKYGDGKAIRDWIFIEDVVCGIILALKYHSDFSIFNFGTGHGTTLNKMIEIVEKICSKKVTIIQGDTPVGDAVRAGICDYHKSKEYLNWEPKTKLEDGLRKTYQYMVNEKYKKRSDHVFIE